MINTKSLRASANLLKEDESVYEFVVAELNHAVEELNRLYALENSQREALESIREYCKSTPNLSAEAVARVCNAGLRGNLIATPPQPQAQVPDDLQVINIEELWLQAKDICAGKATIKAVHGRPGSIFKDSFPDIKTEFAKLLLDIAQTAPPQDATQIAYPDGYVMVPKQVTPEIEAVYANNSGAYQSAQELHNAMIFAVKPRGE